MTAAARNIPNFAGVALVDILANGVAMLIIVIVVSIAARTERDARHTEQTDDIAAVMSHKFSTSLVLNSLAASRPAVLHDYANSPLDQILEPQILPILELHATFVREFYSGRVWHRRELLQEYNGLHALLDNFDEAQKQRLRLDIYDVGQFYVTMSILRAHNIQVTHWHFLDGALAYSAAVNCPPGVAAQDCRNASPPARGDLPHIDQPPHKDLGEPDWPPRGVAGARGDGDSAAGDLPGGVAPGAGAAANRYGANGGAGGELSGAAQSPADLGSFPGVRGAPNGQVGGIPGGQPARANANFRVALPASARRAIGAGATGMPTLEAIFGALLHYLQNLQNDLDAGGAPAKQIAEFAARLQYSFANPPKLDAATRTVARDLAIAFAYQDLAVAEDFAAQTNAANALELNFIPAADGAARLLIPPNRLIDAVGLRAPVGGAPPLVAAHIAFALHAYPDIWRGLHIALRPGAVVLTPPKPRRPEAMRWRAVAHISAALDDFVVGFVFANFAKENNFGASNAEDRAAPTEILQLDGEVNRARVNGVAQFSRPPPAAFGARGWLVSLYAALAVGLLLLAVAPRWFRRRRSRALIPAG